MTRPARLLSFLVAFALSAGSAGIGALAQPAPTIDKLVATFDDVVFGAEIDATMRARVVAKWQDTMRIRVVGAPKPHHIDYLRAHLKLIARLTGLEFGTLGEDEGEKENVTIVFVPANRMSKIAVDTVDPGLIRKLAGSRSCYFLSFRDPPTTIIRSIIVVNNERTSRAINHCLLEEVLQSLGLPNDTNLIRPSLFSDLDNIIEMSRSDEILVRALYDPRLVPGTPRTEALRVVRGIIEELDATLPRD